MHKDLKIAIPRHIKGGYWDLVRKHGGSRKAMVDFICGIGGYQSRDITSAIEFNIKAYSCDLDVEHLWRMLTSGGMDVGPDPKLPPEHMTRAKALFWRVHKEHEEALWNWACEEAYQGWKDSDTPYETFTGRRIDWDHEVHGRSSGHLCMTHCAGINLEIRTEELGEWLNAKESDGSYVEAHAEVRDLFIICVQNSVDITTEKIDKELEYRAAWRLWVSFCEDELKEEIREYEERDGLSEKAGGIDTFLTQCSRAAGDAISPELCEAFKTICKLADVKIGE